MEVDDQVITEVRKTTQRSQSAVDQEIKQLIAEIAPLPGE